MSGPVIVDSGGANISSLRFALGRIGWNAPLTAGPGLIRAASHVFLPGVGGTALLLRVFVESTQVYEPFSLFVPDAMVTSVKCSGTSNRANRWQANPLPLVSPPVPQVPYNRCACILAWMTRQRKRSMLCK